MTNEINLAPPSKFTPQVTEFRGILESVGLVAITRGGYTNDFLVFDFGDVDFIAATSPQLDSRYTLEIRYSAEAKAGTVWDEFRKSLTAFMPEEANSDIHWFEGQGPFHCKWSPMVLRLPDDNGNWGNRDSMGWKVTAIEGLVNQQTQEVDNQLRDTIIADVINGNNEQDAVMAFHGNADIRSMPGYTDALTKITNGSLLNEYAAEGLIVEVNGIWAAV